MLINFSYLQGGATCISRLGTSLNELRHNNHFEEFYPQYGKLSKGGGGKN